MNTDNTITPNNLGSALSPFQYTSSPMNVTVVETEECGHEILTTFIDDEFVGVYIGKDGTEVFSYLKEADTIQVPRKDR